VSVGDLLVCSAGRITLRSFNFSWARPSECRDECFVSIFSASV
jgi:hypothetical protein